uniref:Tr-type G domain-containing protein n=1 Tax=viral metagenome TaxID=1070528 RepID=A0A6C0ACM6_9ZZZZ
MEDLNYVCVATTGSVDSGKSTISGHLSAYNEDVADVLDSKEKPLLDHISKHPHEREKGQTSDIGYKAVNIDDKEIVLIDLAGHEKYLKTTTRGVTAFVPDCGIVMVGGNRGFLPMTNEHIMILQKMNIPIMINFTKEDIAPLGIYKSFVDTLKNKKELKKKEAVFINEPLKIEMKKDLTRNREIQQKIESYKKQLEKIKDEDNNIQTINQIVKYLSKFGIKCQNEGSTKDYLTVAINNLDKFLKSHPTILNVVITHFKALRLLEVGVDNILQEGNFAINQDNKKFVENYIRTNKMLDEALLPRQFIDAGFRLARLTGNNDFKYLTNRFNFNKINKKQLIESFENSKQKIRKEKNKLSLYNEFINYFNSLLKLYDNTVDEDIQKSLKEYLNLKFSEIVIDEMKYKTAMKGYIEGDATMEKENVSSDESKVIEDIIQDYGRNKEVENLPLAIEKIKEFMIDPNRYPVLVTSCRSGYYLETYKVILSKLEKRKKYWKNTDESSFYIESVISFKNSKRVLPFKGFIVSGIVRGECFKLGDEILIGPHEGVMVKAIIKSIHNNNKEDVDRLVNTERGCFGISIEDDNFKSFSYRNARKGMIITKRDRDISNNICWQFTCNIEINSNSKVTIKNGFRPVLYLGNIRQTVQFLLPKDKIIKSGENTNRVREKDIIIRFTQNPEYIPFEENSEEKTIFLVSEGVTKGKGIVTGLLPVSEDPNNTKLESQRRSKRNKEISRRKPNNKGVTNVL